jgi:hypothetical protein
VSFVASAIGAAERAPLPDKMTQAGIGWLVAQNAWSVAGLTGLVALQFSSALAKDAGRRQ